MKRSYVYVASSWNNPFHIALCAALYSVEIDFYNFKDEEGFNWKQVDLNEHLCTFDEYKEALGKHRAEQGFLRDYNAMCKADACILVLPAGRSANLEAGWCIGQGKPTEIYMPDFDKPDLMYKMADLITDSMIELLGWLGVDD